jgi:hypothetical protein
MAYSVTSSAKRYPGILFLAFLAGGLAGIYLT